MQQCGKKARLSAARLGSSNDWKLVQNWVMGPRRAGIYQGICQELTETPKEGPKSIAFPAFYPLCESRANMKGHTRCDCRFKLPFKIQEGFLQGFASPELQQNVEVVLEALEQNWRRVRASIHGL